MDKDRFDRATRAFSRVLSRRGLAGTLGLAALGPSGLAEAKKRKKRKKKVKRNSFGCVNVGGYCKNSSQCCSGICQGKKGKKTCQAHDESTCQPGQDQCAGEDVTCITAMNISGACAVTTGNASYCAANVFCADCAQDSDCAAICDAGAACIVCPGCGEFQTACASTTEEGCLPG